MDNAADVSPSQLVQILNQGIWVFNKQGQVQSGFPKALPAFWAANSPPPTNLLVDTQIAFDPLAQRWMASTLSVTSANDNGDVYFAISNTSDATAAWTFYAFPSFCSSIYPMTYTTPDQDIMGYNQSWVVLGVSCFDHNGIPFTDSDQLLLIPHSSIATHPTNLGAIQETGPTGGGVLSQGWFGSRPSRDVSGSAGQNIYLVSSGPIDSPSSIDYVKLTSIDSSGNLVGPGLGGAIVQSPANGFQATATFAINPDQHDNCGPSSTCVVFLSDARITSAPVLQAGNDNKHYLLTAFHAGESQENTAQALYFMGQTESFASSPQWNEWHIGGNAPGWWATYPTITMDQDLDVAYSFTTFTLNSTIYQTGTQPRVSFLPVRRH